MNPNRDNRIAGMLRGEPSPMKPFSMPKVKPRLGASRPMPTPKPSPVRKLVQPKPIYTPPPTYENDVYNDNEKD